MKKLTAGIFTVLMGLVSVNAADAAVASKGYVDAVVKTKANSADVYTKTDVYTKGEADNLLSEKADKATTLAGYGITDAYTKAEVDETFETIENVKTKVQAVIDSLGSSGGEGGEGATGLQGTVLKNQQDIVDLKSTTSQQGEDIAALETLVGDTAVATQISNALTDKVGAETVATQISTAVNSLKSNEIKANADAIAALTDEDGEITQNAANIATLQGLVGETSVESQINTKISALDLDNTYEAKGTAATKVAELANGQVKANTDAITAIQAEETGILAQATEVATTKANTAEANAVAGAKTYTDAKVDGLNLQDIARIPAACSDANNYCTLTTNGTQFVWEVIARDATEDTAQPSTTPGSDRLIVSPVAIDEPTDAE